MASICEGRVAVVTGAGRGIGRGHALELARQGARVVVNDLGGDVHGANPDSAAAKEVVEEIVAAGGEAVASGHDVSTADGAAGLVRLALDTFGELHAVVNNAGILRDRTILNMTEDEWDSVLAVHLRGTFLVTREAGRHWRERSKAGAPVDARIVNTSSVSGLFGNTGQSNYGAAKAGIAGFTIIASLELARYGITVNAVSPSARTRMITPRGQERMAARENFDPFAPDNIAPLVTWLVGPEAKDVTGRVFNVHGGRISVLEGWREGPVIDKGARWEPSELAVVMPHLVAKAAANVSLR
ncbi:SDR family oxidoreductase [Actinomadura syzygii]|uniref:SDR family oxidoreductase n=1 Tax=Actinomadura syzygii TaxID=1427538 RepID=A0A5D0TTG7_9ACTN|nr:SDR family oxidoreductase [Actinomadura syzygii]TYC09004.1 SDR family oxidoreductase [Actinomadura syzygii]